jgi:hypothetical protein
VIHAKISSLWSLYRKESDVNHAPDYTALELLKMHGSKFSNVDQPRLLRKIAIEKGWDISDIVHLSNRSIFGSMVQYLLTRVVPDNATAINYNFIGKTIANFEPAKTKDYYGNHSQNKRIDSAAFVNSVANGMLRSAATSFDVPTFDFPDNVRKVRIAIIGYGAAGIMVSAALRKVGFINITTYEKSDTQLGIWKQKNVYERSRNNPRNITFLGHQLLQAPGPGLEVRTFLEKLRPTDGIIHKQANVKAIRPGTLLHEIVEEQTKIPGTSTSADVVEYPIVINCMGLGKPAPLSDSDRMTTDASNSDAGPRWQQTLDREHVDGKHFTFIGLGNSTAEMLRQIHIWQDSPNPPKVDYRILTHYPRDAVFNPDDYVPVAGRRKPFRVFRDLSQPNLVKFHGDLAEFREDYYKALRGGKIISNVKKWSKNERRSGRLEISVSNRKARKLETQIIEDTRPFTLIGYEHPQADIEAMGCTYDGEQNCALYDYDGEFISHGGGTIPETRLYKGYFGFGSVLKAPHNPNAIVIPGMNFRIGDLLFGVIMRAMEVARTPGRS